jgi:hypothetical protein
MAFMISASGPMLKSGTCKPTTSIGASLARTLFIGIERDQKNLERISFSQTPFDILLLINGGQRCRPDVEISYLQTNSVCRFETCPRAPRHSRLTDSQ